MYKFIVYRDKNGKWRWSMQTSNGRIIADSGEGYVYKNSCIKSIKILKENICKAEVVKVDPK